MATISAEMKECIEQVMGICEKSMELDRRLPSKSAFS